jgi:site-specific DNA recombinase
MAKRRLPPVKPIEAVLYCRVSTKKQAETGLGLAAQQNACRAHAERLGLPIVGEFQDRGISGKKNLDQRPGLKAAIAAVRQGPGRVLIVCSLSRLARSMRMLCDVLQPDSGSPLPIVSVTEPFDVTTSIGKAMINMIGTFAQLESDFASERTIEAMACIEDRSRLGAPSMIEVVVDGVRSVDPDRLAKVRRVQELYASGDHSYRSLAEYLNARGNTSPNGKQWHPATIAKALEIEAVRPTGAALAAA